MGWYPEGQGRYRCVGAWECLAPFWWGQLRSLAVTFTTYVLAVLGGRNQERKREVPHGFVAQPVVS